MLPTLTNGVVALRRPFHFGAGMEAIAEHSLMEAKANELLTGLLGADPEPAIAIFEVLRGARQRADALRRVGKEVLTPENHALLQDVMKACQYATELRDFLAHRIWMMDEKLPEAVVLVDPGALWRFSAAARRLNAEGPVTIDGALAMQDAMRKAAQVWTLQDISDAKSAAGLGFVILTIFGEIVACAASDEADRKRSQLKSVLAKKPPRNGE